MPTDTASSPPLARSEISGDWLVPSLIFAAASFTETLGFGHFGAFNPLYLRQLGASEAEIPAWTGYLMAASFSIGLPLAPLWGIWADKYSRKLVIARSAYVEVLVFGLAAISQNVWHLLAARILAGFVLGNTGVMYAVLSQRASRPRVGTAIAAVSTGSTLGLTVGPLLGSLLIPHVGLSGVFVVDAALSLVTALLITVGFHERRDAPRDPRPVLAILRSLPATLRDAPLVVPLFALYALILTGVSMSNPFVPLLVEQLPAWRDLSVATSIGLVLTANGLATAVAAPLWGRAGDRWGHLGMLALGVGACAVLLAVQVGVSSLPGLMASRALMGVAAAGLAPLVITLIATRVGEERRGAVLNLALFPFYFALIAGSALGGVIGSFSVRAVFGASALLTAAAFFAVWRLAAADNSPGARSESSIGAAEGGPTT